MLVLLPINSNIRRCKIVCCTFCAVLILEFSLLTHACFLYPFSIGVIMLLFLFFKRCSLYVYFLRRNISIFIYNFIKEFRLLKRKCFCWREFPRGFTIIVDKRFPRKWSEKWSRKKKQKLNQISKLINIRISTMFRSLSLFAQFPILCHNNFHPTITSQSLSSSNCTKDSRERNQEEYLFIIFDLFLKDYNTVSSSTLPQF